MSAVNSLALIWRGSNDTLEEPVGIVAAEMEVGDMSDPPHVRRLGLVARRA